MTPPPAVLAEVDLDRAPEPPAPVRRSPLLVAAVAVAVVGLVGAAALRSAVEEPPAAPRPAVTAWASVATFTPGPDGGDPVADLVVTVSNRSRTALVLTDVAVDGPRVAPGATDPGQRPLPAGGTADVATRVPLACADRQAVGLADAGITVRVTVTGGHTVQAASVGVLAVADGACRAAQDRLPDGWTRPLEVESVAFSPDAATLVLAGLPAGSSLVALYTEGTIVPVVRSAPEPDAGRLTLDLAAPQDSCHDAAERIPFGLQVRLQTQEGLQTWYAAIGPDLARWLLRVRGQDAEGCRARPVVD